MLTQPPKDDEVEVSQWLKDLIENAGTELKKDKPGGPTPPTPAPAPGTGSGEKPNTPGGTSL